jgi:hypothetical protein
MQSWGIMFTSTDIVLWGEKQRVIPKNGVENTMLSGHASVSPARPGANLIWSWEGVARGAPVFQTRGSVNWWKSMLWTQTSIQLVSRPVSRSLSLCLAC